MLLDSDKDILENSYGKWFERMYESFENQLRKQLEDYKVGLNAMVFEYEKDMICHSFPLQTAVFYRIINEEEKDYPIFSTGFVHVNVYGYEEKYIKESVTYIMSTLVNDQKIVWTKIEPVDSN